MAPARVEKSKREKAIRVEEMEEGGVFKLQWGTAEFFNDVKLEWMISR